MKKVGMLVLALLACSTMMLACSSDDKNTTAASTTAAETTAAPTTCLLYTSFWEAMRAAPLSSLGQSVGGQRKERYERVGSSFGKRSGRCL